MIMQSRGFSSDSGALDLWRLRYLAENFQALRGLDSVAVGIGFALYQMAQVYWRGSHWGILSMIPLMLVLPVVFVYVPRYYARRFGYFQPRPSYPPWSNKQILTFICACIFGFILLQVSAELFQSLVPGAAGIDPNGIAIALVFLFVGSFLPRRRMCAFVFAGAVVGVALVPFLYELNPNQLFVWRLFDASCFGLCIALLGLWNHVALVRLFPKRKEAANDEQ